jgi:hypothetical protein
VSEQAEHSGAHERTPFAEPASVELTGHDAVDGVLRSLDGLEDSPVEEHVAVFEAAHETLRAALAEAADRPGGATAR